MDQLNKTRYCLLSQGPTLVMIHGEMFRCMDGRTDGQSELLTSYFFSVSPGESLPLSTVNQITIKFTTVGPETAKGFHFVYQGEPIARFSVISTYHATVRFIYSFLFLFC